jgi:hypothetical protein
MELCYIPIVKILNRIKKESVVTIYSSKSATIVLTATLLAACNQNDDNVQLNTKTKSIVNGQFVDVVLSKGPITGATCSLFDDVGKKIADSVISNKGSAKFQQVVNKGIVFAECAGGEYTDEATGVTVTIPNSTKMRGVTTVSQSKATLIISPITEIAFQKSAQVGKSGALQDFKTKLIDVSNALGLGGVSIDGVTPSNFNTETLTNNVAGQYGALLYCLSQYQKDNAIPSLSLMISQLSEAMTGENILTLSNSMKLKFANSCDALHINPVVSTKVPREISDQIVNSLLGAKLQASALPDIVFTDNGGVAAIIELLPSGALAVPFPFRPSDIKNPVYTPSTGCVTIDGTYVPNCYDPDNSYWIIDASVNDTDNRELFYSMSITSELADDDQISSLRDNLRIDTKSGKITQVCLTRGAGPGNINNPYCYDSYGPFEGGFDIFKITVMAKTVDGLRSLSRSFIMKIRDDG